MFLHFSFQHKRNFVVLSSRKVSSSLSKMQLRTPLLFPLTAVFLYIVSMRTTDVVAREESSETERIIGGRRAQPGQFPYAAALFKDRSLACTCSIIGPTTVLTAAHCVVSNGQTTPAERLHAIANVDSRASSVQIDFSNVTPHPNYSESGIQNDIAVLRTTKTILFSATVGRVCIAREDTAPMEYADATAMGYGDTTRLRIFPSRYLNYVAQRISNNADCGRFYGNEPDKCKICAEGNWNGTCNGDSGGPLVNLVNNIQIGIVSYGTWLPCGTVSPVVFCRVSCYTDFIKEASNGDTICIM